MKTRLKDSTGIQKKGGKGSKKSSRTFWEPRALYMAYFFETTDKVRYKNLSEPQIIKNDRKCPSCHMNQ